MLPDSFVDSSKYKSFTDLITSLRIGLFHCQATSRKRQPNLNLVFLRLFCIIVYFVTDACLFLLC